MLSSPVSLMGILDDFSRNKRHLITPAGMRPTACGSTPRCFSAESAGLPNDAVNLLPRVGTTTASLVHYHVISDDFFRAYFDLRQARHDATV